MSDPASNVEIEDVLASVRRLVSADRHVRTDPPAQPAARPDQTEATEALVLTADFRVGSPTASELAARPPSDDTVPPAGETATEEAAEAPQPVEPEPDEPRLLTLEERIAELEAAVQAHAASEFEPDGSEDLMQHRPVRIPGLAARDAADDQPQDLGMQYETPNQAPPADAVPDAGTVAANDAAPAHDTAPATAPEAGEDDGIVVTLSRGREPADDTAVDPSGQDEDAAPAGDTPESPDTHIDFDSWEEIYAGGAASDAARPDADFHAAEEAAAGADAEGGRLFHADPGEDALSGLEFASDSLEIDEDTLRDLVAEIVREELQGALGERITRNVRKLVRREIMRALSIRDFE